MRSTAGIIALTAAAGCASIAPSAWAAVATLEATKGNAAAGTVSFVQKGDKVVVTARITGLAPGPHDADYLFDDFLNLIEGDRC